MNSKILLLVALLLSVNLCWGQMKYNFNKASYRKGSTACDLNIPVTGGSGTYYRRYTGLPSGWKYHTNGDIEIPNYQFNKPGKFPIRCSIRDSNGVQKKTSILVKVSKDTIQVEDKQYAYNCDFTQQQNKAQAHVGVHQQSNSNGDNTNDGQETATIGNLPSEADLNKMIAAGNVDLITQTIKVVVSINLKCKAKISYLTNFLGRINSAIQMRKMRADELKTIIENARAAIEQLTIKINALIEQQHDLQLENLKESLHDSLSDLETTLNSLNNAKNSLPNLQEKIESQKHIIQGFNGQVNRATLELNNDRNSLSKVNGVIQDLEVKLSQAKNRRTEIKNRIDFNGKFIQQTQAKIVAAQQNIRDIELKISNTNLEVQNFQKRYHEIEINVQKLRNQLNVAQTTFENIQIQINVQKAAIDAKRTQLDQTQLHQVSTLITILEKVVLQVQQSLDTLYYSCKGVSNIHTTVQQDKKNVKHQLSDQDFHNYVKRAYGLTCNLKSASDRVKVSPVRIFSEEWKKKYGSPFKKCAQRERQNRFQFEQDFKHSQDGNGRKGCITHIEGNRIKVKDNDNQEYDLIVGSCSRIEDAKNDDAIPKVGDNLYWKGQRISEENPKQYRLQTCTCH